MKLSWCSFLSILDMLFQSIETVVGRSFWYRLYDDWRETTDYWWMFLTESFYFINFYCCFVNCFCICLYDYLSVKTFYFYFFSEFLIFYERLGCGSGSLISSTGFFILATGFLNYGYMDGWKMESLQTSYIYIKGKNVPYLIWG